MIILFNSIPFILGYIDSWCTKRHRPSRLADISNQSCSPEAMEGHSNVPGISGHWDTSQHNSPRLIASDRVNLASSTLLTSSLYRSIRHLSPTTSSHSLVVRTPSHYIFGSVPGNIATIPSGVWVLSSSWVLSDLCLDGDWGSIPHESTQNKFFCWFLVFSLIQPTSEIVVILWSWAIIL